jgi:hypothetical protein
MAASQPAHEHEHEHEHEVSGTSATAPPRPTGPVYEHEPPAQRSRRRGHLGLSRWMTAAAVTLVVAALAALLLGRAGLSGAGGVGGASTSWHTYHDPFGLFTLRVPPGWVAQVTPTTGSFGDRSGGVTERMDQVGFNNPAQGTGPGSAFVSVFAIPLQTAVAHQTVCRDLNTPLQPFAPLTLRSMVPSGHQLFTTETASFQVDVGIPGVVMPEQVGAPMQSGPPTPTPTPLPAAWVAADKSAVNAMLVSFRPTDPKPLTC